MHMPNSNAHYLGYWYVKGQRTGPRKSKLWDQYLCHWHSTVGNL